MSGILISLTLIELALRVIDATGIFVLSSDRRNLLRYDVIQHHDRGSHLAPIDDWRMPESCAAPTVTVVIGGDSWMREPEFGQAFLRSFYENVAMSRRPRNCLRVINTGTGSYSPSLIQIRLAKLLAEIVPEIVVISIDETDIMDEWVRYRHSLIFDNDNRLIAVPPFLPDLHEQIYYSVLDLSDDLPLYLLRILERAYMHGFYVPRVRKLLAERNMLASYDSIMAPQRSREPYKEFAEALDWFEERMRSLLRAVRGRAPNANIVLLTHPHYLHVAGPSERRYKFSVAQLIEKIAAENCVAHLAAADDFEKIHPDGAETAFRWPEDPFSHLRPEALSRYGAWAAKRVAATLKERQGGERHRTQTEGGACE